MRFKRKLYSAKHLFAQTVAPWGLLKNDPKPSPDLDGGGPGAPAWWEAPCADTESLGRGMMMVEVISISKDQNNSWFVDVHEV